MDMRYLLLLVLLLCGCWDYDVSHHRDVYFCEGTPAADVASFATAADEWNAAMDERLFTVRSGSPREGECHVTVCADEELADHGRRGQSASGDRCGWGVGYVVGQAELVAPHELGHVVGLLDIKVDGVRPDDIDSVMAVGHSVRWSITEADVELARERMAELEALAR